MGLALRAGGVRLLAESGNPLGHFTLESIQNMETKTTLILNSQFLNAEDRTAVRLLADSADLSRAEVAGYGPDYYFHAVPKGWTGETTRVVSYGPNEGLRIWDARRA